MLHLSSSGNKCVLPDEARSTSRLHGAIKKSALPPNYSMFGDTADKIETCDTCSVAPTPLSQAGQSSLQHVVPVFLADWLLHSSHPHLPTAAQTSQRSGLRCSISAAAGREVGRHLLEHLLCEGLISLRLQGLHVPLSVNLIVRLSDNLSDRGPETCSHDCISPLSAFMQIIHSRPGAPSKVAA